MKIIVEADQFPDNRFPPRITAFFSVADMQHGRLTSLLDHNFIYTEQACCCMIKLDSKYFSLVQVRFEAGCAE